MAHKECAQQTAKVCRKAPKGFFDSLAAPIRLMRMGALFNM